MKIRNSRLLYLLSIVLFAAAGLSCSTEMPAVGVNAAADGRALRGYDAVAYFRDGNPRSGDPRFEYEWKGAKWHFSSAENLAAFEADPEAYAPQYGGFCAYAVSEGYTADGDPEAWKIVNGRLFLNYNKKVQATWEQNAEERIEKGDRNWEGFKRKKPVHKG